MKQEISKKRINGFGIAKGAKPFEGEKEEHEDLLDIIGLEDIDLKNMEASLIKTEESLIKHIRN